MYYNKSSTIRRQWGFYRYTKCFYSALLTPSVICSSLILRVIRFSFDNSNIARLRRARSSAEAEIILFSKLLACVVLDELLLDDLITVSLEDVECVVVSEWVDTLL